MKELKLKMESCIFDEYPLLKNEPNFSPRIFNKEIRNNTKVIYFEHYVVKGVKLSVQSCQKLHVYLSKFQGSSMRTLKKHAFLPILIDRKERKVP